MALLDAINGPSDLQGLTNAQLRELASEIREFLVRNVARTGGHLGPNLGVVELTIALHRVFKSPDDAIVFDTGHQSYVHKILTGRKDFSNLRQAGGLSGYPSRDESEHDIVENSHATTALSWADGIARGMQLSGQDNHVVAVIGDGALTGGMAWEALNNISEDPERPIIIVVNDNGRSYSPTVGGVIRHLDPMRKLDNVRVTKNYESFLDWGKRALQGSGLPGQITYDALHGIKRGVKDMLFDAGIFDTLGLKYMGPVDGHDIGALEEAFAMAKEYGGPVVVHAITEKGRGYKPAEDNTDDHFHAVGKIHPETGLPVEPSRFGWTAVFADEIVKIARKDPTVVGVTAAMQNPVGLKPFKEAFPSRVIDVGIAEQHAMTMSAGLAHAGYHPVIALYATFLNRGFDQLLMDIALHNEPVTICLDRSGVTGDDGASHNGMWDLSLAAMIPGIKVAVPRDETRMREALREAVATPSPTIVRYPKGPVPEDLPTLRKIGSVDVIYERVVDGEAPIVMYGLGPMAHTVVAAAKAMSHSVLVVDTTWALPINEDLVHIFGNAVGGVVLEDGLVDGGVGSELNRALHAAGMSMRVESLGISKEFISHDKRDAVLASQGMDVEDVIEAARRSIRANSMERVQE